MDWYDLHDYFNELDEGYLTYEQFLDYNLLVKIFRNILTDDEIYSMTNSNNNLEDLRKWI